MAHEALLADDNNVPRTSTVVKNGSVTNFQVGIYFDLSTRSTVRAVTASDNTNGMVI